MSELKTERGATREEVAQYLREFADRLDGRGGTASGTGDRPADGDRGRDAGTDTASSGAGAGTGVGTGTGTETESGSDANTGSTATGPDADTRGGDADADTAAGADATDGRTATAHPAGKVTLLVGNDSATINPPREVTFGVEVGSDSSLMSGDAEVVEFRMHWDANEVPEDDELRIE